MPPTTTILVERLTLDGPIPLAVAALAGCAVLWLFVWSLRRERSVIGTRNMVLFAVLRALALIVVLYMLLAPSTIRSQRTETRQAVAVVVDVSDSMRTVDPPGTSDDRRWTVATSGTVADSITASADRALAAATIAERRLNAATATLHNQQAERLALESASAAHTALEHARANMRAIAERLPGNPTMAEFAAQNERVAHILQILDGSDFRRLGTIANAFQRGQDSLSSGWRECLADVEHQMAGVRRRLAELVHGLPARDRSDADAPVPTTQSSRLVRVSSFLDKLEAEELHRLRDRVDVTQLSFASFVTPSAAGTLGVPTTALSESANGTRSVPATYSNGTSRAKTTDSTVTDITAALEHLRREKQDQPLAAAFLFTDAGHNKPDSRDPRVAAAELSGTPIYVIPVGNPDHLRDVDLKSVSAPGVVMKDDDVVIEATLQAFDCEAESCRVELLRDGAVIQHRNVEFESATAIQRVRFNTQLADVGLRRFQVRAVPLDGELSEENNLDQFEVNVTRNHIDVLLADELPRWEYRYLAQLFRRDAKIACDELLFRPRMIATGRRQESQSLPRTVDEWDQYDVVVIGDVSPEHFDPEIQQSLTAFLRERGGTLILIAGQGFMPQAFANQPLADILPVTELENASAFESVDGYAFQVTDDGWKHHALMIADSEASTRIAWDFINRSAPLFALSPFRQAKPSARTLITAIPRSSLDEHPDPAKNAFLCWQSVGRGRVVYLAGPETYRLRFLRGDRLHYRFWGQLLRWAIASDLAAGSELVSIRTDRPEYRPGDNVQVVVRLHDEAGNAVTSATVDAVATGADDSRATIRLVADETIPGRYAGSFDRLTTGIYRMEPSGPEVTRLLQSVGTKGDANQAAMASFMVRAPLNRELLDTRSDRTLAQQIADATGGQVLPPTAVSEVLGLTDLQPVITQRTETLPLWVQWKFLWIVLGCLFSEWIVRKRMGWS